MSEIKRLLNSLLWEIYGRIPSSIARKHSKRRRIKMQLRLYEPRLLAKLSNKVLSDIGSILELEIRLMSKYLERVLISRDKNRTHQTILYGFLDVIVSSRLGESSREMRFNLSPPPGAVVKGRGEPAARPIITDETNSSSDFNQWLHAMKMVARLPGGMPPEFRRKLWLALAEKYLKSKNVDWEKEEVKCFSEQWREDDEELGIQIVKDLHRTGSSLCSGPAGTINQAKLKRILLGYARYNPEVGYCQGFNMLGALILQVMDKEEIESIKVMIYLVEGILPRGYFSGSLGGLQADMAVFRELMTCKLPRLAKHLQKLQGPVENAFEPPLTNVFTMQWFLTMFCTCLPMTCVLRVWDLVLIEGSDVLLRTALVLWNLLEERILNARTADDFYCKMGSFSSELLNGHLIDSNGLIEKVVDLGPIPELQKLRDKHLYNISPFRDKKGLQLYYSDEDGDSDEDSRMAVATAWGLRLSRRGSAGLSNKTDSKDRIALDISLLKKQYDRLRERQRQAHIILTSAVARQGSNPNQTSIQMNQLLIGRNAIVTNNGRRLGPPQGAIPPARKPSLPTAKSPKPTQTKTLRRGETLHWRDTDLSKRRRGSLKWKDIKSDSSQSGQDDRPPQLIESAPSSRSSSSEPKSQRGSLKARQRSDSSSYSEDSDGNSSTSTSLCDEDDHEGGNVSSLEGSPMKKSKKKHSEVPHKKCLEDVLNSNEKPHTVDSQIPFIQLTTMDSPVLNANKTDIASIEYVKEDSETESNRLDYAGFVDEFSWPDMNEGTSSGGPLEDITIDVTSDDGDFLSLSNVITSTSQLSPIPDITTYINNSNISPLRTPISAFDYTNLVVSIDDSKTFDVNDEGVTNEYFERINIVERPTKLDLLYSLNEEDSIRNAYKMPSCQSSPELGVQEQDAQKREPSPEKSKFLMYEKNTKTIPPSTEELDRKMKVLLEYSNQSSLSFIAEAKHEISSGIFKEEFDAKSLKYQPSTLVPSNRAAANVKPVKDETIENVFVIPSLEKKNDVERRSNPENPYEKDEDSNLKLKSHQPDYSQFSTSTKIHQQDGLKVSSPKEFKEDLNTEKDQVMKIEAEDFKLSRKHGDFKDEAELTSSIRNSEIWFGNAASQIPSTEDLETRFKALEMSFTDRKGHSAKPKVTETETEPATKGWFETKNKETNSETIALQTSSILTNPTEVLKTPLSDVDLKEQTPIIFEEENKVSHLQQASEINEPLHSETQIFENKKHEIEKDLQQTSGLDKPHCIQNQKLVKEKEEILSYTVPKQDLENSTSDQGESIILPTHHDLKSQSVEEVSLETSVIEKSNSYSNEEVLEVAQNQAGQMNNTNQGDILVSSETLVSQQNSKIEGFSTNNKDVSEVDQTSFDKSETVCQMVLHLDVENKFDNEDVILQAAVTEKYKIPLTEAELEVGVTLEQNNIVPSEPILIETSSAQLLSCSQDHFEDKSNSESKLESPIASKSLMLCSKPDNIKKPEVKTMDNLENIQKTEKKEACIDEFLEYHSKSKNLIPEDTENRTIDALDAEKEKYSSLFYSEDHFVDKPCSNSKMENIVIEYPDRKSDIQKHEHEPKNVDTQLFTTEKHNSDGEHATDNSSLEPIIDKTVVRDAVDTTQPQKPKIPTTEDLETRFMALERQLSEKRLSVVINQSDNKDTLPNKDSALSLHEEDSNSKDQETPSKSSLDIAVVTAKPIPSTADLEHRFRQLERKLSSKNLASPAKATPSQEDDSKALRQSNIVTNPSIVLPSNETPSSSNNQTSMADPNDQPPFIRKRIPSTEDLESRFQALEIQKSLKSPTAMISNLLSPSKPQTEFAIGTPEMDTSLKRKSDIPSTEDLENRFQALEQSKIHQKSLKEEQPQNQTDNSIPSTKDLETRFQALEQRKPIVDACTKTKESEMSDSKPDSDSKTIPTASDLEIRFQTLEQQKVIDKECSKPIINESADVKSTESESNIKNEENKAVPSTKDLESRYEALEKQKSMKNIFTKSGDIHINADIKTSTDISGKKKLPSTEDLESRFEALEQRKSISGGTTTANAKEIDNKSTVETSDKTLEKQDPTKLSEVLGSNILQKKLKEEGLDNRNEEREAKLPSTKDLEKRFDALEQSKSNKNVSGTNEQNNKNLLPNVDDIDLEMSTTDKEKDSLKNVEENKREETELVSSSDGESKLPSTQDLESRFDALEKQKSLMDDSKLQISTNNKSEHKKLSKVPSTHDLEKRFNDMQIERTISDSRVEKKDLSLLPTSSLDSNPNISTEHSDQHKRKDLYKLESQSDETLTATDPTSTEFDTKTESRPTSCPEYSEPFDSNVVTTDRVLKIIEENSKILHRILKKTLADASDNSDTNAQSKKSNPGITDSLLALGNIFPRNEEAISPSRMKSHSWIRPSITLRSDDNISDRLASIKSTIKSIDTLCEEKSFRKEKCQRYIDSLFARPTITTTTTTTAAMNPSIKVDDFECKPSQERVPKRELKKDISPRRRRDEEREEYESRVRRDMMPNSIDAPSDLSFSLANIEQVDSEVDRINQGKQIDTQLERPLSPYYVSGYDLNKRSITPVVYIPTKLEIRHTTVTSTFYDRYLTEKHIERTFPRSKKSPVSPTITKSYLDISSYSLDPNDRSSKSAENSPSRRKDRVALSPNETVSLATNKRNLVSTLEVAKKDLHIRSCDNILLQLRSSTNNKEIVPSIMVYNPLPTKIRKPPELGISLGLYKDYGSDESSKS